MYYFCYNFYLIYLRIYIMNDLKMEKIKKIDLNMLFLLFNQN